LGADGDDVQSLESLTQADRLAAGLVRVAMDGGNGADNLIGSAGVDALIGGTGIFADSLRGGLGDDSYDGGLGNDVYYIQGTDAAEKLEITSTANIKAVRKSLTNVVQETDGLKFNLGDFLFVWALAGDDLITVANSVTIDGEVDGGADIDTCTAPAIWEKFNCEL